MGSHRNKDQFNKRIGSFFKDKRLACDLTQKEVSKLLGHKTSQFVSNWERGLASPPLSTIKRLIKIYELDPHEVLSLLLEANRKLLESELNTKASN